MELIDLYRRCKIKVDGISIPPIPIVDKNIEFISDSLRQEENQRVLSLHLDNAFMLSIMCSMVGMCSLLKNDISPEDVISRLRLNDIVLYKNGRASFQGIDDEGKVILKQAKSMTQYVPVNMQYLIKPYGGNAQSLDSKGVRNIPAKKRKFISNLLDIPETEVPPHFTNFYVVVCDKSQADFVANKTIITNTDGEELRLSHIFSSSFFTATKEIAYSGNVAKATPVLRFVSSMTVAREIIINNRKECLGLIVFGARSFEAGYSELADLMERKSLPFICIMEPVNNANYMEFIQRYEELKVFAWTNNALAQHAMAVDHCINVYDTSICQMIDAAVNTRINTANIPMNISSELYTNTWESLKGLAEKRINDEQLDEFIILSYSLLKLFTNAIFTLKMLEESIRKNLVVATLPKQQIARMTQLMGMQVDVKVASIMESILLAIEHFYQAMYHSNAKYDYLMDQLLSSSNTDKYLLVVLKAYYGKIFVESIRQRTHTLANRIEVVTSRGIKDKVVEESVDVVICSVLTQNGFNPIDVSTLYPATILVYEYENAKLAYLKSMHERRICRIDSNNYALPEEVRYNYFENVNGDLAESDFDFDIMVEKYVQTNIRNNLMNNTSSGTKVDIARIASFESGEIVYFTKNYRAYVISEKEASVIEKSVASLVPGDLLVFSKRNEQTKDIVDMLLERLVNLDSNQNLRVAYQKSTQWKMILQEYIDFNSLSLKELSARLKNAGFDRQPNTIKTWLDSNSHIVGPREKEAFDAIAQVTQSKKMIGKEDMFYNACNTIRSIRIRLLGYMAKRLVSAVTDNSQEYDFFRQIEDDIGQLTDVLQIEWIVDGLDTKVPFYISNHPYHDYI